MLQLELFETRLRTMGDAALLAFLTIHIESQLVILKNTTYKPDVTVYIIMTVTTEFYFFRI